MKLLIHRGPLEGQTIDFDGSDEDRYDLLNTGFATQVIEKPPQDTRTRIQRKKRMNETADIKLETPGG